MCRAFVEVAEDEKRTKFDYVETNLKAQICLKMDKLAKNFLIGNIELRTYLGQLPIVKLDEKLEDIKERQNIVYQRLRNKR